MKLTNRTKAVRLMCSPSTWMLWGKKKLKHSAELHSKILPQQQPQATKT